MQSGQWLRPEEVLPDLNEIEALYVKGAQWQLYTLVSGGSALAVSGELYEKWIRKNLVEEGLLLPGPEGIFILTAPLGECISSVEYGPFSKNSLEVKAFARALKRSAMRTDASLADGIYVSRFGSVLPAWCDRGDGNADRILGSWICEGMQVCLSDTTRIRKYAPWLPDKDRSLILELFGIQENAGGGDTILPLPAPMDQEGEQERPGFPDHHAAGKARERKERKEGEFSLPGRPALERFFREEILDVIDREEEYRRFGAGFPGATLLYGPSGSGKTFAAEKLADYLGWPVFRINSGTIGSKYVHETSRRISEIFDTAIREAPSVLIIDEMEAFLSDRENARGSAEIHMEEVGEFLRRIPDAAANHVLLFGMTNMPESIDSAVLRKGRFDHILEVGMPSASEVLAVLKSALKDLPAKEDLNLSLAADLLADHPLSDVAFALNEAGRLCVRRRKKAIDTDTLIEACKKAAPVSKEKRRVGFSFDG